MYLQNYYCRVCCYALKPLIFRCYLSKDREASILDPIPPRHGYWCIIYRSLNQLLIPSCIPSSLQSCKASLSSSNLHCYLRNSLPCTPGKYEPLLKGLFCSCSSSQVVSRCMLFCRLKENSFSGISSKLRCLRFFLEWITDTLRFSSQHTFLYLCWSQT